MERALAPGTPPRQPDPLLPSPVHFDVTAYLTLWLVLLYGISAGQVLGPLGAIGQPALVLVMPSLFMWAAGWVLDGSGIDRRTHTMRAAMVVYLWFGVASYGIAMSRPLTELEFTGSHRALITLIAMCGVALLTADGIGDTDRLRVLLRRLVTAGAFLAVIGILQFFTGGDWQFRVPGLQWQNPLGTGVGGRSIFNRPRGTATHPIELSVMMAALLPLAIHFALYEVSVHRRRNAAFLAGLIAVAMPLAISRSGIVSIVVGLFVLMLGWNWRRRLYGLVVGIVAVPLLWLTVPGLVGTLRSLFQGAENDPSVQARIDRVPRIMEVLRERPWFGRGIGTWSVEDYFLIDNQFWVSSLEVGIVGVAITGTVITIGVLLGVTVRSRPAATDDLGHLGRAIGAAIAALGVSFFTFDALFFNILTGTLFLLLGAAGCLWRLTGRCGNYAYDSDVRPGNPA